MWEPEQGRISPNALDGVDAVIHLAGENIMGRWSDEKKARILNSRVEGTRLLATAIKAPSIFICASAVGFYGERGDEILTEESATGSTFLAQVSREWEAATRPAADKGVRVVNLRFGMILSRDGGAMAPMLTAFKTGVGGRLGSGKQYWSWITMDDVLGVIRFALESDTLRGPVNTVAPHPVTNAEFTDALGNILKRPTVLTVPAFLLRTMLGDLADETMLASARVLPQKLEHAGYTFQYPDLEKALAHII